MSLINLVKYRNKNRYLNLKWFIFKLLEFIKNMIDFFLLPSANSNTISINKILI